MDHKLPANFKEILWPPNGFVYDQEYMLPAFCKPKLCPLKSNMNLDKKRQEALDKLREIKKQENETKVLLFFKIIYYKIFLLKFILDRTKKSKLIRKCNRNPNRYLES